MKVRKEVVRWEAWAVPGGPVEVLPCLLGERVRKPWPGISHWNQEIHPEIHPGHTPLKSPEIHPTVCCLVQTSFVKGTDFQFSLVLEPSPDGTIKVWESGVTMALAWRSS